MNFFCTLGNTFNDRYSPYGFRSQPFKFVRVVLIVAFSRMFALMLDEVTVAVLRLDEWCFPISLRFYVEELISSEY